MANDPRWRRRGWRQLALREATQPVPRWGDLPAEVRCDVIALLGQLLRAVARRDRGGDE
jgi:hypothetical protein